MALSGDPDALKDAALVFDLDGTLVDTAPDITGALNHILTAHGRAPIPPAQVRAMVGQGAATLLVQGFNATGEALDPACLPKLFDDFIAYYGEHIADTSVVFPGVRAALERYRRVGAKLGVCTNKPFGLSMALLEALDLTQYFPVVLGADSLKVHKPDPEHFRATVRGLRGNDKLSVMIGDSPTDVATARAAGVPVVAVTFGYTPVPPETFGADFLIDHFDRLDEALIRALTCKRGELQCSPSI